MRQKAFATAAVLALIGSTSFTSAQNPEGQRPGRDAAPPAAQTPEAPQPRGQRPQREAPRVEPQAPRSDAPRRETAREPAPERRQPRAVERRQDDNADRGRRAAEQERRNTNEGRRNAEPERRNVEREQRRNAAQERRSEERRNTAQERRQEERRNAAQDRRREERRDETQSRREAVRDAERQQSRAERRRDRAADPAVQSQQQPRQAEREDRRQQRLERRAQVGDSERARIRDSLRRRNVGVARNVNVNVAVGVAVPRRVRLYVLPPPLISIVPVYASYRYFETDDYYCIVDPETYVVVDVIDRGGPSTTVAVLDLSPRERRLVRRSIAFGSARVDIGVALDRGADIPDWVDLRTFPRTVLEEIPRLKGYRYVVVGDDVVIVGGSKREVALVIGG
jgi:hypothetical protein